MQAEVLLQAALPSWAKIERLAQHLLQNALKRNQSVTLTQQERS
jgi:hypothetical protein